MMKEELMSLLPIISSSLLPIILFFVSFALFESLWSIHPPAPPQNLLIIPATFPMITNSDFAGSTTVGFSRSLAGWRLILPLSGI